MIKMERVKSVDLKTSSKSARSFIEGSTFVKTLLKVVGVLGVSLVMSGNPPTEQITSNNHTDEQCRWHLDACSVDSGCNSRVRILPRANCL